MRSESQICLERHSYIIFVQALKEDKWLNLNLPGIDCCTLNILAALQV